MERGVWNSWIMYHVRERNEVVRAYSSEKGAKIGTAAANRNAGYTAYQYMPEDDFYRRKATVKNLMTGKDVEIPKTSVGTVCDPSTERYWSM